MHSMNMARGRQFSSVNGRVFRLPVYTVHGESNSRVDLGYGARKCWSMGVKVSVCSLCLEGRGWIEINRSERREFDRNLSENFGYHC